MEGYETCCWRSCKNCAFLAQGRGVIITAAYSRCLASARRRHSVRRCMASASSSETARLPTVVIPGRVLQDWAKAQASGGAPSRWWVRGPGDSGMGLGAKALGELMVAAPPSSVRRVARCVPGPRWVRQPKTLDVESMGSTQRTWRPSKTWRLRHSPHRRNLEQRPNKRLIFCGVTA